MNEEEDKLPEGQQEPETPVPMIRVYGEGYITRQNGERVPFTIQTEG